MPTGIYIRIKKPWNTGKKIDKTKYPNYGHQVPHSSITKEKLKILNKDKIVSPAVRLKISNSTKGKPKSEKTRINMSIARKGKPNFKLRETIKKFNLRTGEKSNNWKGGISFEPYSVDWTETLKRAIRERDNYICQLCSHYGNNVHHEDYNKKNCNPENLITLCSKCNVKVNYNREKWIEYFSEKLKGGTKEHGN